MLPEVQALGRHTKGPLTSSFKPTMLRTTPWNSCTCGGQTNSVGKPEARECEEHRADYGCRLVCEPGAGPSSKVHQAGLGAGVASAAWAMFPSARLIIQVSAAIGVISAHQRLHRVVAGRLQVDRQNLRGIGATAFGRHAGGMQASPRQLKSCSMRQPDTQWPGQRRAPVGSTLRWL